MPKSKTDPKRKDNVKRFKENQKQKNMPQELPQPDPIRQVPVWKSTQNIEMNGLEFEAIFNYINAAQGAYGAIQSILQRNILNGGVDIAFEKLNEEKTGYVSMTAEEQAPHKAEVAKMINALKSQAAKMVRREDLHLEPPVPSDSQEGVPFIDALVDTNGNPVSSNG